MKEIIQNANIQMLPGWKKGLLAMVGVGVGSFLVALLSATPERAWEALLINTVFWGGIAQGGVMLSVIWQVTDARWGRPFKRVAEGFGAFLPVTFVMFLLVMAGSGNLYEWIHHPIPAKSGYLNIGGFVTRNLIGFLALYSITFFFLISSLKPDMALARKWVPGFGGNFGEKLLKNYGNHEDEVIRLEALSRRLAPILGMVYTVVISLIAFDFVMSLDQEWYSTLFGVFFFVGNLYSTLAMMLIVMYFVRKLPGLDEYVTINRMHDLAKLTFAFAMLWTYMTFSQYLIYWYANIPEEAGFLVTRSIADTPWKPLFWTLFGVLFIFPFLGLMSRTVCRTPKLTAIIGAILLTGQWWAHYILVVPSIQDRVQGHHAHLVFLWETLVAVGFAGGFFLCFFWFMSRVPVLPISDKHLVKTWHGR